MNNEKIVIVEDEKIIALDLQRRLERFGYQVVGMASDGPEAIAAAEDREPDIILMDIMLTPTRDGIAMDGIEAARVIKSRFGIPVIFLTAYTDEKTLERAKEVEPFGYILKPFKERELYTTIDIALYKNSIDKKLRKQERLFSAILHSINDAIISTDMNLVLSFMNPAAEAIAGCSEAEARGRPVSELLKVTDKRFSQDFLAQPVEGDKAFFFNDTLIKNAQGQNFVVDGSITKIHEQANTTDGYVFTLRDISELKRLSETISYQASHDILTGLSNREEFSYKLNEILKSIKSTDETEVLIVIDVDRFKAVNDACGTIAGDELLRQVAAHIQANISRRDFSARIGGDEFAIIVRDCRLEDGINVAHRLQEAVQAGKFIWQNSVFPVTLSIGAVPLSRESQDIHAILAAGDDACHISKEEGGNKISVYSADDTKYQKRRGDMEWIAKINRAVDENRFVLYHQPIVPLDADAGLEAKAEVLIRLVKDDGSIAGPGDFIPAAERYNLMPLIDRWVVKNSLRAYRILMDRGAALASGIISINLSGPSLLDEELIVFILAETQDCAIDPAHICFEITETAAIQNLSYANRFIGRLKDRGFTFALDDFGSGFSSFNYLRNLPVDYLKIDGSFVQSIDESPVSLAMVESINAIGHVMGIKTIAEFVKSPEIKRRLIEIGVDYAQGYEIAIPSPLL